MCVWGGGGDTVRAGRKIFEIFENRLFKGWIDSVVIIVPWEPDM